MPVRTLAWVQDVYLLGSYDLPGEIVHWGKLGTRVVLAGDGMLQF
jgi:hypothetical protein